MNIFISEMKVASIMTQSRGHIMYSGRVLNTSLWMQADSINSRNINYYFANYRFLLNIIWGSISLIYFNKIIGCIEIGLNTTVFFWFILYCSVKRDSTDYSPFSTLQNIINKQIYRQTWLSVKKIREVILLAIERK